MLFFNSNSIICNSKVPKIWFLSGSNIYFWDFPFPSKLNITANRPGKPDSFHPYCSNYLFGLGLLHEKPKPQNSQGSREE